MNRRSFLTESSLAIGAGVLAATRAAGEDAAPASVAQPAASPEFKLLSAPVLTNPAPDGMTVLWAASGPATGWVEYGETETLGQRAAGSADGLMPFDERCFKIRLSGLKPGTRYHYRVHGVAVDFKNAYKIIRNTEVTTEIRSFTTPNPGAESVRFTVWNDTHENATTLQALHQAHASAPGDFLLWNGDQTNEVASEQKMVAQFLSPAGLPFAASTPYYYVRGNHDVRGASARKLGRFTDVPGGQYYYSFRQGPLAALVLDTGEDKPDSAPVYAGLNDFAAYRSEQIGWLAREIERLEFRSAPFRILFCHIPLWWKNETKPGEFCADGRAKWHDLLVKAGIRLVISGHTHQHAWLPADANRPYGQIVGGGPKPGGATYMRGEVTGKEFRLTMHALDGAVLETVVI